MQRRNLWFIIVWLTGASLFAGSTRADEPKANAGQATAARGAAGAFLAVYSVAFSPDGKQVLTGGLDYTARLWDAQSGKELRTFTGHANRVSSVAFSPDGKQVLTGS